MKGRDYCATTGTFAEYKGSVYLNEDAVNEEIVSSASAVHDSSSLVCLSLLMDAESRVYIRNSNNYGPR